MYGQDTRVSHLTTVVWETKCVPPKEQRKQRPLLTPISVLSHILEKERDREYCEARKRKQAPLLTLISMVSHILEKEKEKKKGMKDPRSPSSPW